jgi:hypothetical protein
MASTSLSRTPSSAGNRRTWTWSGWIKRSELSNAGQMTLFGANSSAGANDEDSLHFNANDTFRIVFNNAGAGDITTSAVLRDTSAWYHIVIAVDTTQATASDRVKIYINGTQQTSFSPETYPSQNYDCKVNNTVPHQIGYIDDAAGGGGSTYFNGLMTHIHFIDGTAYDASAFGQADANGVWTINTSPSVTYGTNGFFILKDGNSVTDQSGNGNNFTVAGGTLTNTEDNPSNVFATWNPLAIPTSGGANTFSNGNLEITNSADAFRTSFSTIGVNSGKWYWEAKFLSGEMKQFIGISKPQEIMDYVGQSANSYSYMGEHGRRYNNSTQTSYGTAASTGDIFMVAFDADNGAIWVGKNGTWFNSATQAEIEAGTTTNAMYSSITMDDFFVVGATVEDSNLQCNFGNGYFGTTAVASAGTNASGIGIFEYDVPTGYTALSTKGLNL